ncbi:MAG: hypothetical protein HN548_08550 [Opitutae bacterium]|jgi:hypothetical protein|nr:hypothetical protein [Opitutae bacterium]MBT5716058.1 hypothetical protein [Opitutae bacterium]
MQNSQLSEKDRALRSKIRMKMSNLRSKLQDFEDGIDSGDSQQSDVDACKGEIEVLRKELQSLVDGGHTTFIRAKSMLEPKKNLSSKEKKLDFKAKFLKKRLKSAEKKLLQEDISAKLLEKQEKLVEDLKIQIETLSGERKAIKNFNHTRFIQLKDQESGEDKQSDKLHEVDQKINDLREKISKCSDSETEKEKHLKDELHLLEMEKESIENFTHDHFLENLASMKAKRKSGLR